MKFLLDENVERRLAVFLKRQGYDIQTIGYDYPKSLRDRAILALAVQEKRILLTSDYTDFYDLIFRQHLPHSGVIVLRLNDIDITAKQHRILDVIAPDDTDLEHTYLIVTPLEIIEPPALSS